MEMALALTAIFFAGLSLYLFVLRQRDRDVIKGLQHDPVTSLPFEGYAMDMAIRAIRRASNNWSEVVEIIVIFTDASGLREVNKVCGQVGGDEYLRAHARHLLGLVRPPDVVFRRGGGSRADELVAILVAPIKAHEAMAAHRLPKIRAALRAGSVRIKTRRGEEVEYLLKPHVGISVRLYHPVPRNAVQDSLDELLELIEEADKAMEKFKAEVMK